jgi:hypothetical protein
MIGNKYLSQLEQVETQNTLAIQRPRCTLQLFRDIYLKTNIIHTFVIDKKFLHSGEEKPTNLCHV